MLTRKEIMTTAADVYLNLDYSTELSMAVGDLVDLCFEQMDLIEEQNKTIAELNEKLNDVYGRSYVVR